MGATKVEGEVPDGRTVAEALAADERLLTEGRPVGRADPVAGRSISVGVSHALAPAFERRAAAEGLEVVRRATGGSGVVHEAGDLTWSVVLPRSDPRVARGFVRAYALLGAALVRLLGELGLAARWADAPGDLPQYCPLSGRGQVLVVNEAVLGGAAQHATRAAVLHHGMVSLSVDRPAIARLFALADARPLGRLGSLRELGVEVPPVELARRLRRSLEAMAEAAATEP